MEETTKTAPETAKPGYLAVLPSPVRYDERLPSSAKLLYAEISALSESYGYAWASNDYFARLYGISERTVIRLINALEAAGYLITENGGTSKRRLWCNLNHPAFPGYAAPRTDKNVTGGDKNVSATDKNVTANYNVREKRKKETDPPKAPQGAGADIWDKPAWDRFWAIYPRKVDKAKAIRAWNKLKADRKLMQIMSAALKAQRASEEWRRDNGRAIPYPSTWLNNRRWEDELEDFTPAAPARAPAEEAIEWEN